MRDSTPAADSVSATPQYAAAHLMTLHLTVNNHPGVMSHICGLFARRAFNLEAILVTPEGEDGTCDVWLLVNEDKRMEQIISQVRKLHDVLAVRSSEPDNGAFTRMASMLSQ